MVDWNLPHLSKRSEVTGCCLWKSILWGWPLLRGPASRTWSEGNRQRRGAVVSASSPTMLQQRVHASLCAYVPSGWSQTVNIASSVFDSTSRQSASDKGKKKRCSLWLFWSKHNRREEREQREGGGEEEENEECVCGWRGGGVIIPAISKNRGLGKRGEKKAVLLKITAP